MLERGRQLAETFKGMPHETVAMSQFYNQMDTADYEAMLVAINYTELGQIADIITRPESEGGLGIPLDAKIYDVGCGSGMIGKLLTERGYHDIIGTDASQNMMDASKAKGCYKELRCLFNGMGLDKFPDDLKGRFDLVTSCGVWLEGHIPNAGFDDCHAALKPGGYFVTAMRSYYDVAG